MPGNTPGNTPVPGTSEAVYSDGEPVYDEFPMPKSHEEALDLYKKVLIHKQALLRDNFLLQIKVDEGFFEIERLKSAMRKAAAFLANEVGK